MAQAVGEGFAFLPVSRDEIGERPVVLDGR